MAYDGLHDVFTDQPMGALTEQRNDVDKFTRAEQDEFAARSHQKAAAAWKDGVFTDEVVPVNIPQRKGDPLQFTEDEGIRANTTAESLAGLKPAFRNDGTITAGSASQISDGAAAVVVMNKEKAQELGLTWLVEIGAHGVVAGPDSTLQSQPANAIKKALDREGISVDQLDVVEINEAFAAVALASTRELGREPRDRQRQRRRDRGRAPDRHVGSPDHAARGAGIGAPRLRLRGCGAVWRRRPGRRADSAGRVSQAWSGPSALLEARCARAVVILRHISSITASRATISGRVLPAPGRRRHRVDRRPTRMTDLTA